MNIEETVEAILANRKITRSDQEELMSLFSQGRLTAADIELINRVYKALNQGRLRVVD